MAFVLGRAMIVAAALMASGCSSTSLEETAPTASADAASTGGGPDRSQSYPDITALVRPATVQMSDQEAASMSASLQQLSASRASGAISEGEYRRRRAEMERIAAGHGSEALSAIEN